jgi:hypothetical protein
MIALGTLALLEHPSTAPSPLGPAPKTATVLPCSGAMRFTAWRATAIGSLIAVERQVWGTTCGWPAVIGAATGVSR